MKTYNETHHMPSGLIHNARDVRSQCVRAGVKRLAAIISNTWSAKYARKIAAA